MAYPWTQEKPEVDRVYDKEGDSRRSAQRQDSLLTCFIVLKGELKGGLVLLVYVIWHGRITHWNEDAED
jgi:hypothetical protein